MKSFLSEVVEQLLKENSSIVDLVCVLPSERAGVFLKEEFKKQISGTTFLPKIISIEKFIETISGFQKAETVPLLFEFYKVYLDSEKVNPESFDSFAQWASIGLQDFNEVDRHLVDCEDLFSYLKDIKRIEDWDIENGNSSEMMNKHLSFMENLGRYYFDFYNFLKKEKKGYQGLLYREAANKVASYIDDNRNSKIALIGFNALNKAEEKIFKILLESNIANVYWDSDAYYVNSKKEAGSFLRNYKSNWTYFESNPFDKVSDNFSKNKNITEIAASKNITQIKGVGELLEKLESSERTALVLADESLLSLTLNSLPANVDKLNITMGYLLKDMPISGFFETVFDLYLNQVKLDKVEANAFYFKDVFRFLENPFTIKLFSNSDLLAQLKQNLIAENQVFISSDLVDRHLSENEELRLLGGLFKMSQSVDVFLSAIILVIDAQKENFEGFEKECLFRFYNLFVQLQNLNGSYSHIKSIKTLKSIYKQLIATEKLSFQGEPLSGLQLMGMLETRVLDFETVILTSMNEGILPAGKSENSFIPFDVKQQYNLPTYQEKDAIFAYHFYRLIQRANDVYLFYNTETDAYGAGEKSRFLTQLEIDGIEITKKSIAPLVTSESKDEIVVEKTDEVISTLKKIAANGFSPSALAKYIEDPLSYYKRYVLKIKDLDEVEETVAANTMGTIIHDVLEDFYKPYIGHYLKPEHLKVMLTEYKDKTEVYFRQHFKNGNIVSGKNKLIFEVSKDFICRFLQQELDLLKSGSTLKILGTETVYSYELNIPNLDFPINVGGSVDRIDELDGVLRIVDYKTGKVAQAELKLLEFEKIPTDYKYTKAMQVMLYAYLYTRNNNHNFAIPLEAGIFSFKNRNAGFLKLNFAKGRSMDSMVTEERIVEFMEVMHELITEIFDKTIPFKENKDRPFQ
ncbi:PD-(D/E)XK nuclease family protein [Flavicella sp.]|uniref:PD-(D/E)XK nuclease family protein n=1 Tax=Flavicella sp. TaxID=2957742 RepID=UPI0026378A77|nr:PD-(D/E)XK nuclease family protein [Flavicella sp.]MDG1805960.1 PD-(D/E)XK nuclease family protein [Flavicella sp.]